MYFREERWWSWSDSRFDLCPGEQVNLLIPISYLLFWVVLLCFSLYSEPVVCGLGMVIMLTGVPVYFVGVWWKDKPKWISRAVGKLTSTPTPTPMPTPTLPPSPRLCLHFLCCVAEKVTYMGQKVCYVVFPQQDPSESEPLTSSKATD